MKDLIFNGKKYKFTGAYRLKADAAKIAKALRNAGGKVRIQKAGRKTYEEYSPAKGTYRVYVRFE